MTPGQGLGLRSDLREPENLICLFGLSITLQLTLAVINKKVLLCLYEAQNFWFSIILCSPGDLGRIRADDTGSQGFS